MNNQYSYQNSANSVYMGAEAAAEGQLLPWLRLQGSYSFIWADSRTDQTSPSLLVGNNIKDIPSSTIRYGLKLDPAARLSLSIWGRTYVATSTQDKVTGADSIPAVVLIDSALTYTMPRVTLQLLGNNLTDRYYERGGTVARPLARKRFNVEASLAVRF
jgi:outer membrane receptor protein involved in Fe transport